MKTMDIQVLIFDADGVMIKPWRFSRWLETHHQITPIMMSRFFQVEFDACLLGKSDLKEVLPTYLEAWGWKGSLDNFVQTWLDIENAPDEDMIKNVSVLKQAGYPCYLATNQEALRADYIRHGMCFKDIFDDLFFSCDIGVQKPDPAFYHHINRQLAIPGEQILFWDDSPKNIEGAIKSDWLAELFTNIQGFQKRMNGYIPEVEIITSG